MAILNFTKTRSVRSPERGTPRSAGIDFFIPEVDRAFIDDIERINKKAGTNWSGTLSRTGIVMEYMERILIPSGIKVALPEGTMLVAHNKGGVGGGKGLDHLAEVVDEDYEGEILISVVNLSTGKMTLPYGSKIIQFIVEDIKYYGLSEITELDIQEIYSSRSGKRKQGALGSTGK